MKFERLGWVVAAALLGGVVGMGFQDKKEKTGTVDLNKVLGDSEYAKKQIDGLRTMATTRQSIVEFVGTYRAMKVEDANKFRDLTLKANAGAADKTEIERIRTEAQQAEQKFRELTTKTSPSQAELTQIEELNKRKDATGQLLSKWQQDFSNDIRQKEESLRGEFQQRAREVVQQVAKDQGYSIVFAQEIAPYSANDMTADALKAMNAKK